MLNELVGQETVDVHLRIEEAEALARVAKNSGSTDEKTKALASQALDQIGLVCHQVRERVRLGDTFIDAGTRSIPRREGPVTEEDEQADATPPPPRPRYRPLGDPDNLSLKEAGAILGKARNTIHGWYRNGKFPPAIDASEYMPHVTKPVIVVPRYRLEAWQAGERMPAIFQAVFESHGLHEAPWLCYTPRRSTSQADVDFWVERQNLRHGRSRDGRRIYGPDLQEDRVYELTDFRA